MIKQLLYSIFGFILLMACEESDYYPPGLLGYQVEHLLTGGDLKVWELEEWSINGEGQELSFCFDSLQLEFRAYGANTSATADDSTVVHQLTRCDTVYIGTVTASVSQGADNPSIFTDSLLFENGVWSYAIVEDITSLNLRFRRREGADTYNYYYTFDQ